MSVRLIEAPFDPGAETNAFLAASAGAGAAVTAAGVYADIISLSGA